MMNTALFFIFVSAVARAAPADGNDVAVISDPSAEFRGKYIWKLIDGAMKGKIR